MGNENIKPDYNAYIGGGSFGHVYRGTYNKQPVAVKIINVHMLRGRYTSITVNEIPFVKQLKHQNILTIFAWEVKGNELWLALELCDGSLDEYLEDRDPSTNETSDIIRQCANSLCYLHRNQVIHGHLKPDSFMTVMDNGKVVIKLGDFSLCKAVNDKFFVVGKRNWLAPEVFTECDNPLGTEVIYTCSMDVFSFALVIIYVLVNSAGRKWLSITGCWAVVKTGGDVFGLFDQFWRNAELKNVYTPLLQRMLQLKPEDRPTMDEVLRFLDHPGIELNRVVENILGHGSFGVVYKGRLVGRDVAVKSINRHWNHEYWNKLQNETILLKKSLRHPNIIEIISFEDRSPEMPEIWIAMELCDHSLDSFMSKTSLNDLQILDIIWQSAKGMSYLHKNNLVHRDIKPDNFLIKLENSSIKMKVTDFSLSKDIEGLVESEYTTIHGNTHWLAPELFTLEGSKAKKLRFSGLTLQKIDVFSFGLIILYTCVTQQGREDICEKYKLGLDVKRGKEVLGYFSGHWSSDRLQEMVTPLLKTMLNANAEDRPPMEEVCRFFSSLM